VELKGRERSPDGPLAIFGVNRTYKRRDKESKKCQRKGMAHQVEKNKPPAVPPHVANQMPQVVRVKMMAEVHGEGHIRKWQRIVPCVGLHDRNGCRHARPRIDVHANHIHTQTPAHLFQNQACRASYIQDPADRQRIVMNRPNNAVCVPHPTVNSGNVAICTLDHFVGKTIVIEYFGLVFSYHPIEL
jgi:hypothetical protein